MRKKENVVIIVMMLVMVLAIIGVSYAAFSYSKTGNKVNSITTGSITMTYTETDNTITLNGALPTTDKTGMVRLNPGEYFDFTVSSSITGDVNINYEISAKDITTSDRKIDGSNIKLYLTRLTGDGEEELMTPETYNEETTANDYTGRPSGEMSLYTSSMSSSESNNYRLRMWVDEDYNPQGDGGNLTFSVQINVYGAAGDKPVPLTTQTILEDNELQVEKTNMFNYASNGDMLTDPNEMTKENNPEYITNGLYSAEDEDGTSYYYRGNVDNNNVQFGEYTGDYYVYSNNTSVSDNYYQSLESCTEANGGHSSRCSQVKLASAGDKMYWKIIRVNGDGSLRLIYNGTNINQVYDKDDITTYKAIGRSRYNLNYNDSKYAGYTYDNGTDSFIKKEVDTWYKNALGNTIYDSKVIGGRFCSDSSGYKPASEYGFSGMDGRNIFASYDRLAQVLASYAKPNNPTLKCPSTSESYGGSYRLKAGLITADEASFAGNSYYTWSDNYLTVDKNEDSYILFHTMTPAFNYDAFTFGPCLLFNGGRNDLQNIRPVINVTTDNGFISGDGTTENPYVIS